VVNSKKTVSQAPKCAFFKQIYFFPRSTANFAFET